jgi:DUF2911 family protein
MQRLLTFALATLSGLPAALIAQTRGFVARLGVDTFAVERLTRHGDRVDGEVVRHTPSTTVLRYAVRFNPDGTVASYEEGIFLADGSPAPPAPDGTSQARMTMTFTGDSVIREWTRGGQPVVLHNAAPKWTLPAVGGTSPYWQELAVDAVKRSGQSDLLFYTTSPSQQQPNAIPLRVIGADSAELIPGGFRRGYRLDRNGHLLRGDASLTTVKLVMTPIRDANIAAIARAWAARDAAGAGMGVPSTRDTVRAVVGGANVSIDYGRPAKRGREIWGKLVPFDTVWRFGANAAAQLTTDHDLEINAAIVPAGSYSIWLLPSAGQSYLIVNSQTGQWGTMYDSSKDLVRIPVSRHVVAGPREERFRVTIEAGRLLMVWDDGGFEVPLGAKP